MIKFKLWIFIFLAGLANGLSINSCVHVKQNDTECTTSVTVPIGGKEGLIFGPKFTLKGMVLNIV